MSSSAIKIKKCYIYCLTATEFLSIDTIVTVIAATAIEHFDLSKHIIEHVIIIKKELQNVIGLNSSKTEFFFIVFLHGYNSQIAYIIPLRRAANCNS